MSGLDLDFGQGRNSRQSPTRSLSFRRERPGSTRPGVLLGISAYAIWGLFPLFWPLLEPAAPLEILAHRVVWSLVFVLAVLAIRRRPGWLSALRGQPGALPALAVAAVLIAVNWGVYIYAVNSAHVVEASLGYFINPLVSVLLGVGVLREALRPLQWGAVAVAIVAVVVLVVGYAQPPWMAFTLAITFATYGLLKKTVGAGAVESLAVETAVLFPPALAYLVWQRASGRGSFAAAGIGHALLLVSAGVVTAVPLMLFAGAATRIPLTLLGLLQYLNPVLQFLLGVGLRHEAMSATAGPVSRWCGSRWCCWPWTVSGAGAAASKRPRTPPDRGRVVGGHGCRGQAGGSAAARDNVLAQRLEGGPGGRRRQRGEHAPRVRGPAQQHRS